MNTENSWSRFAKEFSSILDDTSADEDERFFSREFRDLKIEIKNKRKLKSNKEILYKKNVVAKDVALANIEEIESTELVSKWIADGICTPTKSEQNIVYQSTSELISELEKSPVINCRRRSVRLSNGNKRRQNNVSPDLKKSPVLGGSRLFKKRRKIIDCSEKEHRKELSSIVVGRENETAEDRENIVEKISGFLFVDCNRSTSPSFNEKRCLNSLNFEAVINGDGDLRGFREREDLQEINDNEANENNFQRYEDDVLSQDIFEDCYLPKEIKSIDEVSTEEEIHLVSKIEVENFFKEEKKVEEILGDVETNCNSSCSRFYEVNDKYLTEKENLENVCTEIELASCKSSSNSFIQDTEDLLPIPVTGENFTKGKVEEFIIIDSQLSQFKTEFVRDTEKIDFDTSSDSNKSDRTVSDIIEEPLTQECIEIYKPIIDKTSNSLINSVSKLSSKISATISVDISIEATTSKEQESFANLTELNFSSTKKKKTKAKKGSLSARLRKLVDGDISSIRLWRHQMSNDPIFNNSSTPFTMLSVIEHSVQCGINFYRSKFIEDPFDLLKVYLDDFDNNDDYDKNGKMIRDIVVITRTELTGKLILPIGTIFNIYKPWKIYNSYDKNLGKKGDLIIQAFYLKIISIDNKFNNKEKKEDDKEKVENFNSSHNNVKILRKNLKIVTHEYNCPCLINGKIDDSCTTKFKDNQKINIMNIILL